MQEIFAAHLHNAYKFVLMDLFKHSFICIAYPVSFKIQETLTNEAAVSVLARSGFTLRLTGNTFTDNQRYVYQLRMCHIVKYEKCQIFLLVVWLCNSKSDGTKIMLYDVNCHQGTHSG